MPGTLSSLLPRLPPALATLLLAGAAHAQAPTLSTGPQSLAALTAKAQALITERAGATPGRVQVTIIPPTSFSQPACSQMEAFLAGNGGLQSRTSVGIRCLAPRPWTTYLQASVQIIGPYLVARHALARGTPLSSDDIGTREGDLLRNRRAVTDRRQALGWITTRVIRAGGVIESSALRDPHAVQRGDTVRTVARGTGFVASGEGQAMGAGRPGAEIQVRVPGGRIITGTIIDSHTVQVMM